MNHIPCPGRIVVDLGDGFSTGCALGALWYFMKGSYFGMRRERIKGGLALLRSRAPILGGSFGMWACIFSVSSCIMVRIRQKEDQLNSTVGGFATGFVLSIRGGFRSALRSGIIGGLFLTIIESIMVWYQNSQKRGEMIKQNREIAKFKKELEKSGKHKFKKNYEVDRENLIRPMKYSANVLTVGNDMVDRTKAML